MADDLGVQFFTAANGQHESIAKWHLIALAVLAYLHLALVVPFVEQTAKKTEVERDLAANRKLAEQLAPIVISAKEFGSHVQSNVDSAASDLRKDLIAEFKVLNDTVDELAKMGPEKAGGPDGEQLFHRQQVLQNQTQQQQQQQQQPELSAIAPTLDPMTADLRRIIAEAAKISYPDDRYFEELGRYISDHIIAPAFQRANDAWAGVHRPNLITEGDMLDSQLQKAIASGGTVSSKLGALQKLIAALRAQSQNLTFAPPPDPDWWRTVAGKTESIRAMIEAMQTGIREFADQEAALQALAEEISKLIPQKEQDAANLTVTLQELEQQAKDLQAQLGEIGSPLKVIAVKLADLAPLLPLIIALVATAVAVWKAEFLQRMRLAASLVQDGAQGRAVRGWLRSAAGGSGLRLAAKKIAIGILMIAWVLAAARSTSSLPAPFSSHAMVVALAIVGVVGGEAYHWHRSRQALAVACAG